LNTKVKLLFQLIILSTLLFSCTKTEDQIVPNVRVEIYFSPDLAQFNSLNSPGNAVLYPNAGYNHNGVIIFRNSIEEFTAYDATCPQHIETKTAVILDDNGSGGQATCPKCNTIYYFYSYGSASKGYPLRQYNVTKTGTNSYKVYN
jgi:hypothetical protein